MAPYYFLVASGYERLESIVVMLANDEVAYSQLIKLAKAQLASADDGSWHIEARDSKRKLIGSMAFGRDASE